MWRGVAKLFTSKIINQFQFTLITNINEYERYILANKILI